MGVERNPNERSELRREASDASVVPPSRVTLSARTGAPSSVSRGRNGDHRRDPSCSQFDGPGLPGYIPGKRFGLADGRSSEEAFATRGGRETRAVDEGWRRTEAAGRGVLVCSLRGLRPLRSQPSTPRPYIGAGIPEKNSLTCLEKDLGLFRQADDPHRIVRE